MQRLTDRVFQQEKMTQASSGLSISSKRKANPDGIVVDDDPVVSHIQVDGNYS